METKYDVLIPGQPVETRTVELRAEPTLEEIRAIVAPIIGAGEWGWEHVTVLWEGERRDMFVDEHFVRKALPRNEVATEHYRRSTLSHDPKMDPEFIDPILGPAVIFHRQVWF